MVIEPLAKCLNQPNSKGNLRLDVGCKPLKQLNFLILIQIDADFHDFRDTFPPVVRFRRSSRLRLAGEP